MRKGTGRDPEDVLCPCPLKGGGAMKRRGAKNCTVFMGEKLREEWPGKLGRGDCWSPGGKGGI